MKPLQLAAIASILLASIFAGQAFADDLANNAKTKQKWGITDSKLRFASQSGKVGREFTFGEQKKDIQEGAKRGQEFHSITGGTAGDGKYGWVLKKEWHHLEYVGSGANLFQYYGSDGSLLWKKDSVVSATVSNDGQFVFTLEVDPELIATLQAGDAHSHPAIYSSSGTIVDEIDDCAVYDTTWSISKDGRFAAIECQEVDAYKRFQLVFNLKTQKKFSWTGAGFINVDSVGADGSFITHLEQQEKNPATGKYEFKVSTQSAGKLEWE